MNSDHFKGKWNQFKGELKQQWGDSPTTTG